MLSPQFSSNLTLSDKAITCFFKMLESLSDYLESKKEKIHPDTLSVLNSIVVRMQTISNEKDFTKEDIHNIVNQEIKNFKLLKNKIASRPVIDPDDMKSLQAVILDIDWEISDTTVNNFKTVFNQQLSDFKSYKIHYSFLKIINSIAGYIAKQKAKAHTDSISFLHSVFNSFHDMVQHPEMSYNDKLQRINIEIQNFHAFKNKIIKESNHTREVDNFTDDEDIMPALAQFTPSDDSSDEDDGSLTTLSKVEDTGPAAGVTSEPAKPASAGRESVMDDLFTVKESPADELLDAIHLVNVHEGSPDQAKELLNKTESTPSSDIRKFTPQTKANDPIPEIEDRLDAFFNLNPEAPAKSSSDAGVAEKVASPPESLETSFSEIAAHHETALNQLAQLNTLMENPQWIEDDNEKAQVDSYITELGTLWKHDPEKTVLLEIVTLVINHLKSKNEQ